MTYSGNHGSNLRDSYARVPTLDQRAGNFSASSTTVLDSLTGLPFAGNRILTSRISAAASTLLPFIPVPNQEGVEQNFHYATTTVSHSDDLNFRFIRSFGATAQRGRGGQGGGGRRGGGRGGAGGGASNLSVGLQFRWSTSDQTTSFPTTGGETRQTAWNVPVNYTFQKWGVFNTVNAQFNRNHSTTTNLFAFTRNVASEAGIVGVAQDPFAWVVPNLSFSSISSLRDINPSARTDQTITVSLTQMKTRGKHTLRWGGDFRSMRMEVAANQLLPGLYTCQVNIIDDAAGTFAFPRMALYVRKWHLIRD